MIKFSNQVPSVYTSASRDFQYIGWLIDIVLNSVKHNVDDIYNLPNNGADPKLTELLAMTLGFKIKRNYDQKQLSALVAALPRILKYKGTKTAITMAGNVLLAASGASGSFTINEEKLATGELEVTFPVGLIDISLFTDLLDYILPAGMTCHIIRQNLVDRHYATELDMTDALVAEWIPGQDWDDDNTTVGLATIYKSTTREPIFTNFAKANNTRVLNTGLLDNSIIPVINALQEGLADIENLDYTEESNDYSTAVILNTHTFAENEASTTVITEGD